MDHYNRMKRSHKIIIGLVLLLVVLIIVMPPYAFKALRHGVPNIDDYKIFHSRVIEAGIHQSWKISEDYNKIELPDDIIERMDEYDPVAFLIIKDEEIIYEDYWDNYGYNSLSNLFSASKSIVGLAIGAAIDDGFIKSLDQKVGDFIPFFDVGEKSKITIRHLLTMSSGLDWDEAYASLFSPTTEAYYGTDLRKLVNERDVIKEPGTYHYYSSMDTEILSIVILNATGKTLSNYVSDKFWKNMGAKNDALWMLDHENGLEKAYCCFNSNARDVARWGQLILNNGKWNEKELISEAYLLETVKSADHLTDEFGNKVDYYGFQWWIVNYEGHKIPYMRGILGQYVFVIPEKNAVVVRLGHKRSDELIGPNRKDMFVYLDAAFYILESIENQIP